ncbi:uncharacterized protein LOC109714368 [Ananas comosus]|uniref:Uncharacterized protein LOC109714368 n=1 Tax=Ananas comosus TaxID=4615 RepID=A0A6P5FF32_ANACO|nr:uncharacterized protein LOC109714368 [Ananas comosus]
MSGGGAAAKRRVMVVADPGRESAGALEWALSHAVLDHDELLLLHVDPPPLIPHTSASAFTTSSSFSSFLRRAPHSPGGADGGERQSCEFLEAMRATCAGRLPRVRVWVQRVLAGSGSTEEGCRLDKARTILAHANALRVDLLVIGQRRRSAASSSFLGCRLSGSMSSKGTDTAEFLIEHSKCLCVGVQKKGQNAGYLLNTKTHKNFWLLA